MRIENVIKKNRYVLRTIFEGFGIPLGSLGTLLGASRDLMDTSWGPFGSLLVPLGPSWEPLGTSWASLGEALGTSWSL